MTAHAVFFNDTGRDLKVHAASSVPVEIIPKGHQLCLEVLDGRYAFFKVWEDGTLLATTQSEPVCPPPPLPKPAKGSCFLCERPHKGYQWWYEDVDIWVADCPYCGDIVIAVKENTNARHGVWPRDGGYILELVRRGIKRYPDLVLSTDRSCFPNHPHIHLVKKA
jgi:hypothetical protein